MKPVLSYFHKKSLTRRSPLSSVIVTPASMVEDENQISQLIGETASDALVLSHYCSAKAFLSIISNSKIRLSSLKSSNDETEGSLVSEAIARICNADGLDAELAKHIIGQTERIEEIIEGKGFCLSIQDDLLSQWRAYGDDGTGFCIGFSASYLKKMMDYYAKSDSSMTLTPVIYDRNLHDLAVNPIYEEIKPIILKNPHWVTFKSGLLAENEFSDYKKFLHDVFTTSLKSRHYLYRLKHPAFSEECEWRIVTLADAIGDFQEDYIESHGSIKTCIDLPLVDLNEKIIAKVVLGPKSRNSTGVIQELLRKRGFHGVEVIVSNIPYK